jgi:4-amino-4-deoxy-L-arabinose transferase-like glycosyltransferase
MTLGPGNTTLELPECKCLPAGRAKRARILAHTATATLACAPPHALLLAPLVLGAALRLVPWLAAYPLHRDEALYGTWARLIAGGQDPLLLTPWVDKPPLVPYLIAGSLKLFGVSALALRLPGMLASLLALLACYGLTRRAYGGEAANEGGKTAALATFLLAVSPFAILFSPTAFTDPWLTLWLLGGAWAALAERPFAAGLALGLAVASKQQGVLAIPLVLALLLLRTRRSARPLRRVRALTATLLGFALILAPLTYWDSLRWSNRPSFWERSATTYGGLAVAPLAQWPQRAAEWGQQLGYLYGLPVLSALMLLLIGCVGVGAIWKLAHAQHEGSAGQRAADWVDALFALYVVGYLALHFILSFQPWDRYLLPIVPLVAILAARGLLTAGRWPPEPGHLALQLARFGSAVGLATLLAWAAWLGVSARLPVGSDHGAYVGLERIVADLRAQPSSAIIYHQWISWHYDYYLFDAPQERRWWGTPWKLADDAAATAKNEPWRTQWLAVPGWEDQVTGPLQIAMASRDLTLAERDRTYRPDGSLSFTLYQIIAARQHGS